jgi:LuxR family transcriptional regulator, maltose regulon positive regulatory protein
MSIEAVLSLFGGATDGAFAIDNEQRIIYWNEAAEQILGYRAEDVLGKMCWELLQGCTLAGVVICKAKGTIYSSVRDGSPVHHFDLCMKHREGHVVLLNVSTIPLLASGEKKPHGLVHLIRPLEVKAATPGMLRIYLLGQTEVRRGDGSVVEGPLWQRAKVRALLAYLALAERHPVEREALVELLWPEMEHEAALRNLNTTVYNVRRSLEPELARGADSRYIFQDSGQYWLGGDSPHWLDVKAFKVGIRRARIEPDARRAIATYEKTLELYRGDYLLDLSGTGVYSAGEQERYREWYLSALEELGVLYEQEGERREAMNVYLKALSEAPWRETACQRLMRLLIRAGRRAEARRHCRRLRLALHDELGLAPTRETRLLCDELRCD